MMTFPTEWKNMFQTTNQLMNGLMMVNEWDSFWVDRPRRWIDMIDMD